MLAEELRRLQLRKTVIYTKRKAICEKANLNRKNIFWFENYKRGGISASFFVKSTKQKSRSWDRATFIFLKKKQIIFSS